MTTEGPALELRNIDKRFGSTVALSGASLSVPAGSLHMLLGENGAGKTTLLRVAAGFAVPDSGTMLFRGKPTRWQSRAQAFRSGVAVVEQHFSLVSTMTVSENVAIASPVLLSRFAPATSAAEVRRLSDSVGLPVDPDAIVGDLPIAGQQRVEILKALAVNASLLILDEPTASLTPRESEDLFIWLRRFVEGGRSVVVITHRIREAVTHGDSLTVLRAGKTVLEASRAAVTADDLVAAILGTTHPAGSFQRRQRKPERSVSPADEPRAVLRAVSARNPDGITRLRDVSVTVRAGEIVGVAGVEGSGQRELLRLFAGRLAPSIGSVHLATEPSFIPEDRLRDALIPEFRLVDNIALRDAGRRRGLMAWPGFAETARSRLNEFSVHAHSVYQHTATLSGGNQQRLVLARELGSSPALIVAENPARGLDVRATREVFQRLTLARESGAAVVVYSSDIEDLLEIADRMLVCFSGTVRETVVTFEAVGAAMLGAP